MAWYQNGRKVLSKYHKAQRDYAVAQRKKDFATGVDKLVSIPDNGNQCSNAEQDSKVVEYKG